MSSATARHGATGDAGLPGRRLRAVHAWEWPRLGGFAPTDAESEQKELLVLKETLAGHQGQHPDVEMIEENVHGFPVEALRQTATGADLLVVGSRGHGTLTGMVLGPASSRAPAPFAMSAGRGGSPYNIRLVCEGSSSGQAAAQPDGQGRTSEERTGRRVRRPARAGGAVPAGVGVRDVIRPPLNARPVNVSGWTRPAFLHSGRKRLGCHHGSHSQPGRDRSSRSFHVG
ncbi:universal stress protein [Nonomuraea angiospora]|uniref:universal stress protein n=1 Tax=Nonomuraea angiospora TaxID=46172 RepID=UPI0033E4BDD5